MNEVSGTASRPLLILLLLLLIGGCIDRGPTYTVVRQGGWEGEPPPPRGEVLLTVFLPDGRSYDLDRAGLQKLTWVKRKTRYHPQEGGAAATFEGVLLADLIAGLGAEDDDLLVRFTALDDYQIERPWKDLKPLEPILALKQDGRWLTINDYGPLRVILPFDSLRPEPTEYNALWVWQLRIIELRNP